MANRGINRGLMIVGVAAMAWGLVCDVARGQGVPDYGFDWVTIGNTNNAPYDRRTTNSPSLNFPAGRGSVGYEYRMSRLEITTGQWMEFVNTFTTQSDAMSFFFHEPAHWGGQSDLSYDGPGRLYELDPSIPNAAMAAVGGISWRDAARYCNWLNNGKSADVASLTTGAYDTSTWGPGPTGGSFTDAERHLPGARYWIPTLDEYLKAAHYDPNKGGEGVGGWWLYNNRSDTEPVSGPPGVGETSAGTGDFRIPLGSYPQTASAYGLLDLSGGASEWLEDWVRYGVPGEPTEDRLWDGAYIWQDPNLEPEQSRDLAYRTGGANPQLGLVTLGLRLASIPGPSAGAAGLVFLVLAGGGVRRRR